MSLFFIDSNVFVYSQLSDLPEYDLAKAKLEEMMKTGQIAVNATIVSECFYVLARFIGSEAAAKRTGLLLESNKVQYLTIEKTTIVKAIRLAVALKQRINDMIIAQHALDSKADGLLTDNVKHFSGVRGLRIQSFR
jgi:predicted nucleic acid-binding protein